MGAASHSGPLTDREAAIVFSTPQLGWDDLTSKEAAQRCRLQLVADMRRAPPAAAARRLPIDLPAIVTPDDPTPIQAVTSTDLLLIVLAAGCATIGGALALWVAT